jgi:hypothetical protein
MLFNGRISGIFSHLSKFEFSLGRVTSQPWEAVLHFTNSQQKKEIMKSGIDLILGDYPTYLATEF